MPIAPLDASTLPRFKERIASLPADRRPAWGTLSPARMLRHLREVVGMALEEVPVEDMGNFLLRSRFFRRLMFEWWTTWPHGLKAPARFTPDADGDLAHEREALFAALDRFVARRVESPERVARHPVFGVVPLSYWSRMHGVHFEHHFRQFGI